MINDEYNPEDGAGTPDPEPTDALGTIEAYSDDDYESVELPAAEPDYEQVNLPPENAESAPITHTAPAIKTQEYFDAPIYETYDDEPDPSTQGGIDRVRDIPLTVNVELGRTRKEISEILDFGLGTIVVLDRLAGDPVEVFANGKLIARGEVVVIEENYGVRITEIVS
jgi:flagellar motor switch protein FliN/FliY